jgi:hypothetical protein
MMETMRFFRTALFLLTTILYTSETTTPAYADRWRISGNILYFDMGYRGAELEYPRQLERSDVEPIQSIIFENPAIDTISVTGPGGSGAAADEIIEAILTHGLNTTTHGDCVSACANIFLAGKNRSLSPGARLGFHRPYVVNTDEIRYFEAHKERMGWKDEFDYVPWIYDVGLVDMLAAFSYLLSRGVSVDFITRAYSTNSFHVWYPTNIELEKNGVITHPQIEQEPPRNQ